MLFGHGLDSFGRSIRNVLLWGDVFDRGVSTSPDPKTNTTSNDHGSESRALLSSDIEKDSHFLSLSLSLLDTHQTYMPSIYERIIYRDMYISPSIASLFTSNNKFPSMSFYSTYPITDIS